MAAIVLLLVSGEVTLPSTVFDLLAVSHAWTPLLYLIDTAPLFLGVFAAFAGIRQAKLVAFNASLEQQVTAKTGALREALRQAEKANVLISHMADHDPLTGLLNRRRMQGELAAAAALARRYPAPFALVFVDLDRFKSINDTHGHEAGDKFLKGFAALLEQMARETDVIGRWGGDEFVVLLPHTTRADAQQYADRLKQGLSRHRIDIGAASMPALASVGVAVHPDDGADPEALLAHADQAMYLTKRHHANIAGVEAAAADRHDLLQGDRRQTHPATHGAGARQCACTTGSAE
ncbi:MAG: GGDEF domain-containing protein [Burkholderiaceae bacterium]